MTEKELEQAVLAVSMEANHYLVELGECRNFLDVHVVAVDHFIRLSQIIKPILKEEGIIQ